MTNVKTTTLTLQLTEDVTNMLWALARATNGSDHNTANRAIREGVGAIVRNAPAPLQERYRAHLTIAENWP